MSGPVNSPAAGQAGERASCFGLDTLGLSNLGTVYWSLPTDLLAREVDFRGEDGSDVTDRESIDAYVVRDGATFDKVDWGQHSRPFTERKFNSVFQRVQGYFQARDVFVQDGYLGSDSGYRLPVRIVADRAASSQFAHDLLRPLETVEDARRFVPSISIVLASSFESVPQTDATLSPSFSMVHLDHKIGLIGGGCNSQEISRTVFRILSFALPPDGILPLWDASTIPAHNNALLLGESNGDLAGRSRILGWSDDGLIGYGGDDSGAIVGHPKRLVLSIRDPRGVLPAVARITPEQAAFYFLLGYTARNTAGSNGEDHTPQVAFDPCFCSGLITSPFTAWAELLYNRIGKHRSECWLLNTGWRGDGGRRVDPAVTRTLADAIANGTLADGEFHRDPVFGFELPDHCDGVPDEEIKPAAGWADGLQYECQARKLAVYLADSFRRFAADCPDHISAAVPRIEKAPAGSAR